MKVKLKICFCSWAFLCEISYKIGISDCCPELNIFPCLESWACRSTDCIRIGHFLDDAVDGIQWLHSPEINKLGSENHHRNFKSNLNTLTIEKVCTCSLACNCRELHLVSISSALTLSHTCQPRVSVWTCSSVWVPRSYLITPQHLRDEGEPEDGKRREEGRNQQLLTVFLPAIGMHNEIKITLYCRVN